MMISWSHQPACSTIRKTWHPIYHSVVGIYSFSLKWMVRLGSVLLYIQMHGSKILCSIEFATFGTASLKDCAKFNTFGANIAPHFNSETCFVLV